MTEEDAIRQAGGAPATVDSLVRDLRALGVQIGMTLIVHSSLSQMGWVCGGPVAVIQALEEALGPQGTLVMPAHSGDLSDPALWENPPVPEAWWPIIRSTMPAYDPKLTPTRGMGVIAELFRTQEGVMRSDHPHVSFSARGLHAAEVTGLHELSDGLGDASPLARIYELDGYVLLLGVGHSNNTSLHLAEARASYPNKAMAKQGAPIVQGGIRQWVTFEDIDSDVDDFDQIGRDFEATTSTGRGLIGQAVSSLLPQRALVDFAVQWMDAHRGKPQAVAGAA